jgi:hypothetical protein
MPTIPAGKRRCSSPDHQGERILPEDSFASDRAQPSGRRSWCKGCCNAAKRAKYNDDPAPAHARATRTHRAATARADARDEAVIEQTTAAARKLAKEAEADAARARASESRLASDLDALRPEDFDVAVANDPSTPRSRSLSKQAAAEKRQDYSRRMGEHMEAVRQAAVTTAQDGGDVLENMPGGTGEYVGQLAEQERRFGNRRLARSISLFAANEEQARRLFIATAKQYFSDRVTPIGYAKKPSTKPIKRSVCLMLSDLHIGSDLSGADNPSAFGAVEEARRLEYILRQCLDYKPQYREHSELVLMWNGDLIEGLLLHDLRDGAPLAEQKAAFWSYAMAFIGQCAGAFPRVRIYFKPGNHGRDKVRHPGRATSRKWDGHEWEMGFALMMACSGLKNVVWEVDDRGSLDRKPYSIIDLHGSNFLLTHADTEIKLGDPDTKAKENFAALSSINSTLRYGKTFAACGFGHYHKARYQIGGGLRLLWNGALLPPNGHARTMGYDESCGQWLWEAVEGYPVGDVRLIEVGRAQDNDLRLGTLIKPFRFEL